MRATFRYFSAIVSIDRGFPPWRPAMQGCFLERGRSLGGERSWLVRTSHVPFALSRSSVVPCVPADSARRHFRPQIIHEPSLRTSGFCSFLLLIFPWEIATHLLMTYERRGCVLRGLFDRRCGPPTPSSLRIHSLYHYSALLLPFLVPIFTNTDYSGVRACRVSLPSDGAANRCHTLKFPSC